ncbi:securin-like [Polyodon spathula]|uniref:securin-like n=1 Tax=Polyodon spathula TaxID=7913 RepID=UPI001B7F1E5F|nr:securin-like [Polyodon spathula]XP_041079868.1 securin-like [Polyodon spathula]
MTSLVFVDKENGEFATTLVPKNRMRLLSAPVKLGEKVLQVPGKVFGMANPQSARKALGTINRIGFTRPGVAGNEEKSTAATKTTEVKVGLSVKKQEDCPEIERFIPYNPAEFECFDVPDDQRLSHLCLAGLAAPTPKEEVDRFSVFHTSMKMSPLKFLEENFCAEVDSFLQIVGELTVDLPPLDMDY